MSKLSQEEITRLDQQWETFQKTGDEAVAKEAFKVMDRDGNGKIDAAELKAVLTGLTRSNVTEEFVDQIIKACDKNNDGMIDIEEFIRFHKENA